MFSLWMTYLTHARIAFNHEMHVVHHANSDFVWINESLIQICITNNNNHHQQQQSIIIFLLLWLWSIERDVVTQRDEYAEFLYRCLNDGKVSVTLWLEKKKNGKRTKEKEIEELQIYTLVNMPYVVIRRADWEYVWTPTHETSIRAHL